MKDNNTGTATTSLGSESVGQPLDQFMKVIKEQLTAQKQSDIHYSDNAYSTPHLKVELLSNGTLWFVLNRAKNLNSMTIDMYQSLIFSVVSGIFDARVKCFVLCSGSAKIFCAGGDIKNLSPYNPNVKQYAPYFSTLEFNFPHLVNQLSLEHRKPFLCMLQGTVIGGAQSLYSGATYRIANRESFSVSLPETRNGLLGAVFFARRRTISLPLLCYYVLTSTTIGPLDAMINGHINQVTRNDESFNQLLAELRAKNWGNDTCTEIEQLVQKACLSGRELEQQISLSYFAKIRPIVEQTFDEESVFQIIENLKRKLRDTSSLDPLTRSFCEKTLHALYNMSPIALLLTHKLLTEYMMRNETSIRSHCIPYSVALGRFSNYLFTGSDFKEAVKHILIAKTRNERPEWQPWKSIQEADPNTAQQMVEDLMRNPLSIGSDFNDQCPTFLNYTCI